MLKETYYNRFKGWGEKPPNDAIVINVTRNVNYILSPSHTLLMEYKHHLIGWNKFKILFENEMSNDECKKEMIRIKKLSQEKDVYLVCVCWNKQKRCHRYILMDLISKIML